MKNKSCILLFLFIHLVFVVSAQLNGDLDSSFNSTGKLLTDFGGNTDGASSMLIQPDGKIIVAGYTSVGTNYSFALTRYEPDGSLDTSFGGTGKVVTDFAPGYDYAGAIALQANGKIVAGGIKWNGTGGDNALIRYNTDGSLDTTFGSGGKVSTPVGIADAGTGAVLIQPDGKIVAAGICTTPGTGHDYSVVRYHTDGTQDSTFGLNGIVTTDFNTNADFAFAAGLQADGKLIVGGSSGPDPVFDFALVRYDTIGNIDTTFGVNGRVLTDFGKNDEWANALTIQPDGKILMAGTSGSPYQFAISRYNTDGSLDSGFNTTGKLLCSISQHDEAFAVAIQSDAKIIVAGVSYNGSNQDFGLLRLNSDGTLDSTFSTDGKLTTDFGTNADKAKSVALQTDGKIVAAGATNADFAIARYLGNLSTGVIDFARMNTTLFIYPNPVAQNAMLTYTLNQNENISIRILDVQGRAIKTVIENQKQVSGNYVQVISFPDNLNAGVYFIVIDNGHHEVSIKIVK